MRKSLGRLVGDWELPGKARGETNSVSIAVGSGRRSFVEVG